METNPAVVKFDLALLCLKLQCFETRNKEPLSTPRRCCRPCTNANHIAQERLHSPISSTFPRNFCSSSSLPVVSSILDKTDSYEQQSTRWKRSLTVRDRRRVLVKCSRSPKIILFHSCFGYLYVAFEGTAFFLFIFVKLVKLTFQTTND